MTHLLPSDELQSGGQPPSGKAAWHLAAPEGYALAMMVSIAIATYVFVTGDAQSERLLTPALVAAIMIANLVPAMALIVLVGSRLARARATRSMPEGNGRLHVRLVALFSMIAATTTLLVVIFASLLFQNGVDFWFSDRSRGMFENAASLAEGYYQENQREVAANTIAMAKDVGGFLERVPADDPRFSNYYFQQVFVRQLNGSAVIEIGLDGVARTTAMINPDNQTAEKRLSSAVVAKLDAGEDVVVARQADRIEAVTRIPGTRRAYLMASRDFNVPGFQWSIRAGTVLNDYNALFQRSQMLQLQFNGALYLGSLLLLALAVTAAIIVADRIVRPLGRLIGATRTAAEGDLSVRVAPSARDDEIAVLARAFNSMTERLQGQTSAIVGANEQLEARRAFIETVLSGVSSAILSIDSDHRIRLANAAAQQLIGSGDTGLVGQRLDDVAPELVQMIMGHEKEAVILLGRTEGEPATLAAKVAALGEGYVLSLENITQQLQDQRRAAWSDVARRIAHEIKNPLTPIQLAAERLQRRFGDKVASDPAIFRKLTDTIVRQVGDMRRMVDEFSSFARMPKPTFGAEDLRDIVRKSAFLFEVAQPDILFSFTMPDDLDPLVCDRRLLSQCFTNIIKNGVEAVQDKREKFPESGTGHIGISITERTDGAIEVAVEDDGIGLPADRESIAEPYMTMRRGGTGLGLAIVKKIVEQHHGELEFLDAPTGSGTRVLMTLHPVHLMRLAGGASADMADAHDTKVPGRVRNRKSKDGHGA